VDEPLALCVEDDPRVSRLIADELARHGLTPVLCPTAAAAARAMVTRPVLALIDLGLPDGDGLDVLRALHRRWPDVPGVVLTVDDRPARVLAALREGACGYLLKEDLAPRLSAVIDEALMGALPLSSRAADALRRQLQRGVGEAAPVADLTAAEVDLLHGLALGLTYEQCALRAGVTINTVRSHVRAIYRKLDVNSKTEAVLTALRLGALGPG
jgi:DNA-binding NarL/FixJ family response regulator